MLGDWHAATDGGNTIGTIVIDHLTFDKRHYSFEVA